MLVSCIGVLMILEHGSNEIHLSTSERSHNVKRYTVYFIDQVNLNQQLKLEVKPWKKNFKHRYKSNNKYFLFSCRYLDRIKLMI